jgi:hypothetical protein
MKKTTKKMATGGMFPDAYAKGGMPTALMAKFEKSGKDVEKKGMKEGSKADMALDKKQMAKMATGGMFPDAYAKGGMIKKTTKKMATGGMLADVAGRATAAFGKKAAPAPAPKAAPAPVPKDNFVQKAQPAVKKAMDMIPKMKFNTGGMAKKKKK